MATSEIRKWLPRGNTGRYGVFHADSWPTIFSRDQRIAKDLLHVLRDLENLQDLPRAAPKKLLVLQMRHATQLLHGEQPFASL